MLSPWVKVDQQTFAELKKRYIEFETANQNAESHA